MAREIAVLLKGYPRLSETFIAQEIHALEQRGFCLRIYSLRHPTDASRHGVHRDIRAPVVYLPEYLHRSPRRVVAGLRACVSLPGFRRAFRAWLNDLRRDPTPNRVRRFGQALVLVRELPASVAHIHAHFLHTPASVARYAAMISQRSWSCSAHAKDIWTTPAWDKREKLSDCAWLVTCTAANQAHLSALAPESGRVGLVYHGLDGKRFPAPANHAESRDGATAESAVRLLCVGRAVEKKGLDDLLAALARLPAEIHWEFHHVGGGPLLKKMRRLSRRLGLSGRVRWHGPLAQTEVRRRYADADVFVLASRVARDGDRDGLPNVLMEAQSQRIACLSTSVSAIPELVQDGETGVLVAPNDPAALASALVRLIRDPGLRQRLGRAGEARVRGQFSFSRGVDSLAARLTATLERVE